MEKERITKVGLSNRYYEFCVKLGMFLSSIYCVMNFVNIISGNGNITGELPDIDVYCEYPILKSLDYICAISYLALAVYSIYVRIIIKKHKTSSRTHMVIHASLIFGIASFYAFVGGLVTGTNELLKLSIYILSLACFIAWKINVYFKKRSELFNQ